MRRISQPFAVNWLGVIAASFVAIVAAAQLLTSPLRDLLASDGVVRTDLAAWEFGQSLWSPTLLTAMKLVSTLHGTVGILVLAAICAEGWRRHGHLDASLRLLVALPVGMLLNVLVKVAIHRTRPDWALVELPPSDSFPSGHVAEATVFYGSLALEATATDLRKLRCAMLALGAMAMITLVACSRIFLGVHFLSDCVAAAVEGALWLGACFSLRPLKPAPAAECKR
jgi:membrane-associated phospholipid phosphatase